MAMNPYPFYVRRFILLLSTTLFPFLFICNTTSIITKTAYSSRASGLTQLFLSRVQFFLSGVSCFFSLVSHFSIWCHIFSLLSHFFLCCVLCFDYICSVSCGLWLCVSGFAIIHYWLPLYFFKRIHWWGKSRKNFLKLHENY